MALRSLTTGNVLSFRACARELCHGRAVLIGFTTRATTSERIDGLCPVHQGTDCIETYLSAPRVASWSLRGFWSWRSRQRAGDVQ